MKQKLARRCLSLFAKSLELTTGGCGIILTGKKENTHTHTYSTVHAPMYQTHTLFISRGLGRQSGFKM